MIVLINLIKNIFNFHLIKLPYWILWSKACKGSWIFSGKRLQTKYSRSMD